MRNKILILMLSLLGAFLLFYPQTSKASISCRCQTKLPAVDPNLTRTVCYDDLDYADCDELVAKTKANDSSVEISCTTLTDLHCNGTPRVADAPAPTQPTSLDNLYNDLSARKPVLEINIPGLNFSNIGSTTDETGTYFYIAWLPELISGLYKFLLAIVSIVAVVVIIIQGLRVVASGGGEGKTTAYKKIFQAVMGLFIAWGSYAILYNINPALVQFNALKVKVIEGVPLESYVGEEDGDTGSDSGDTAATPDSMGSIAGTKFAYCKNGDPKCDEKCVDFFQQPGTCPFTARLSSPLKTGKIRCNYHIVDPKSKQGAGYDINATYNLDLPAEVQTNIYAPIDGTATFKPKNGRCGNTISFSFRENGKTYTLSMCHLWDSTLTANKKTSVVRGQLIGRTGGLCCEGQHNGTSNGCHSTSPLCQDGESTGRAAAPHLHIGNLASGSGKFPILPCISQE